MEGVIAAANEVYETEERLVEDLRVLQSVFVGPVTAWAAQLEGNPQAAEALGAGDLGRTARRLFAPLDAVARAAAAFATSLRAAARTGSWRAAFEAGEADLGAALGAYAARYATDWDALARIRAAAPAVDAFVRAERGVFYFWRKKRPLLV